MALKDRTPQADERRIDQIIEKGGSVATAQRRNGRKSNFPLRFTLPDVAERIEIARKKRPLPPSVNTWIMEAILEKLKVEELREPYV